jgi:hypothetical protein
MDLEIQLLKQNLGILMAPAYEHVKRKEYLEKEKTQV